MSLPAPIRHALHALGALAAEPGAGSRAENMARSLRLPSAALSKSFQRLAKRGILESRRGPGGGYRIAGDPAKITLARIAAALEVEDSRRGRCLLEEHECRGDAPCALHSAAKTADARLRRELSRLTLADLAASYRARRKR